MKTLDIQTQPPVMGGPLTPDTQPTSQDRRGAWGRGRVTRWHSSEWPTLQNSHDSVDGHQNRMLRLRRMLFPVAGSRDFGYAISLDDAILAHDLPEFATGDWSRPDKDGIPGLNSLLKQMDALILTWLGLPDLPPWVQLGLRLLDLLDAWLWAVLHEPRIKSDPDFLAMRAAIIELAGQCGVSEKVMELIAA